ncbi:MAG: NADH-quinone oxidoreductase subunit J [Bdellovibrionales bacterium]|nr:NADH-quinone oxidoreductase subunit J [Bdellovibrionales bacterium]
MSEISPVAFYLFAGMALAFSVLTVLKKNPVASAFSLVIVFFSFAGIYALLGAHLVATMQILVYAGAIMVLFVFVVMLLNSDSPSFDFRRSPLIFRFAAGLVCFAMFVLFVKVFRETGPSPSVGPFTSAAVEAAGGNTRVISELMFSEYILPFELTSILLLAGIVGSVALAKRHGSAEKASSKKGVSSVSSR